MIKFYDTNIFLNCDLEDITKSKFIISYKEFFTLISLSSDAEEHRNPSSSIVLRHHR